MRLQDLNFRHLLYFHMTIVHGSVSAAAEAMHVSQPTVSTQLRQLEAQLGGALLRRDRRGVAPTTLGQLVARYTQDIFSTSQELLQVLQTDDPRYASVVQVGVADAVPHLLATRLLRPIVDHDDQRARVYTGHPSDLLARLAVHQLDVVISDAPITEPVHHVRAFNHLLGTSTITVLAAPKLCASLKPNFPQSLAGAPVLLPTSNTVLRRSLDHWFDALDVTPNVVAEFEDPAQLLVFGERALGAFPMPSVIVDDIVTRYDVREVAQVDAVEERIYAISTERRIRHPAIAALSRSARDQLFLG